MINFTVEWIEGGRPGHDRFMSVILGGYRGDPENQGKENTLKIYLDRWDAKNLAAKIAELEARKFKDAKQRLDYFEASFLENLHPED